MSEMKIVRLKRGQKLPSASSEQPPARPSAKSAHIRQLNLDSPSFGADLVAAFRGNVAKARKENKRILGVADIDIDKA